MDRVIWNNEAQMVEIITDSIHLLLHPNLEFEDRWDAANRILTERGFSLPTLQHCLTLYKLRDAINGLILAHNGSTIKEAWYWCREEISPFHAIYYDMGDGFDGADVQEYTNYIRAVKDL